MFVIYGFEWVVAQAMVLYEVGLYMCRAGGAWGKGGNRTAEKPACVRA